MNKLLKGSTMAMFFLMPWYYFSSGQLQPVDIAILGIMASLFMLGLPYSASLMRASTIFKVYVAFSTYIVCTLLFNFILDNEQITLTLIVQNIYYFVLFFAFYMLLFYLYHNDKNVYHYLVTLLLLDLILPFGKMILSKHIGTREALTFNNANQLGFYALVNLSLLYYVLLMAAKNNISVSKLKALIILNVNLVFLFASTSRGGYPAVLLYVIANFLLFRFRMRGYTFYFFMTLSIILCCVAIFGMGYQLFAYMKSSRLDVDAATSASISHEFYFRALQGIDSCFDSIHTFLLGNGKVTTEGRNNLEFHNNFIAIFFQFGFIGLLIYLYMNALIIYNLFKKGILYLIPYFSYIYYSMFHYSYRTRMNWIFLAFILVLILAKERRIEHQDYEPEYNHG